MDKLVFLFESCCGRIDQRNGSNRVGIVLMFSWPWDGGWGMMGTRDITKLITDPKGPKNLGPGPLEGYFWKLASKYCTYRPIRQAPRQHAKVLSPPSDARGSRGRMVKFARYLCIHISVGKYTGAAWRFELPPSANPHLPGALGFRRRPGLRRTGTCPCKWAWVVSFYFFVVEPCSHLRPFKQTRGALLPHTLPLHFE